MRQATARRSERKRLDITGHCPACRADWRGDPIPVVDRPAYSGFTHFSRAIGVIRYDRIVAWRCYACKAEFAKS